ncbi:unnamed protein product [Sphagnum jensenii]|uniref:Uncharacterized protein n=1 Tax=Sphagnum jensenii TaxID=128206 RepID=A0ABP1BM03_9BRYO
MVALSCLCERQEIMRQMSRWSLERAGATSHNDATTCNVAKCCYGTAARVAAALVAGVQRDAGHCISNCCSATRCWALQLELLRRWALQCNATLQQQRSAAVQRDAGPCNSSCYGVGRCSAMQRYNNNVALQCNAMLELALLRRWALQCNDATARVVAMLWHCSLRYCGVVALQLALLRRCSATRRLAAA